MQVNTQMNTEKNTCLKVFGTENFTQVYSCSPTVRPTGKEKDLRIVKETYQKSNESKKFT